MARIQEEAGGVAEAVRPDLQKAKMVEDDKYNVQLAGKVQQGRTVQEAAARKALEEETAQKAADIKAAKDGETQEVPA